MENDFNMEDFNITIVGLGLVGGSFARALKKLNPKNIWAVDIDGDALKKGEEIGLIDKGYLDSKEPLEKSDLVIICLYPELVKIFVERNMADFKTGTVITDVTGIKNGLAEEVNMILREDIDFVFGHPMAGREKKGLEYSSAEVFQGANYIITPTSRNLKSSLYLIESMAKGIGFKNIMSLDPKKHDEVISFTSQLPHAIAVALVNSDDLKIETGRVVGDSYRDLTRIAQINAELWSELFIGNKENLVEKIEHFQDKLDLIKKAIVEEDKKTLEEEFEKSSVRRKNL